MDTTNSVTLPPKYPSQYTWKIPPLIINHPHPLQIVCITSQEQNTPINLVKRGSGIYFE